MQVRHLLVAAAAATILAGSSMGAFASSHSFSKGESSSSVVSVGTVIFGIPVAVTIQHQHNDSVAVGSGSGAGASAGTTGGAIAGTASFYSIHVTAAAASGSTSGSSCAGSGC